MKVFRSIRWRLQLWYGALFAAILISLGVAAYLLIRQEITDRTDKDIYRLAFALNGSVSGASRPPPPPNRAESRDDEARPRPPARPRPKVEDLFSKEDLARGFYYAVWRKNDEPRFRSSENAPADLPAPTRDQDGFRTRDDLREAFITSNPGDHALVGRSIASERAEIRVIGWNIAGGGIILWTTVMLIGWWLTGRALRPVVAISSTAERIAGGNLAERINIQDTETELGRLAVILNMTFSRLDAAFSRQAGFTADAAHELRTPVTVLLTHIQNVLAGGNLSEENREAIAACQRAAQRMRRLIESLLQLARFDGGEEKLHLMPCDLLAIAQDTVELALPLAENGGIALHTDLSSAPTLGDPDRIAQVITNLLSNAIHYNQANGEVRISTWQEGNWAFCVVSNTGPGITAAHLPHIFERFYRVESARTGSSGRTGLGLAISRAIIEALGGKITVQSEPGQGATFTIRLPLGGQKSSKEQQPLQPSRGSTKSP